MKYPTVFHLILEACRETGVTCVLVGGFAVNYYKYTRQTADVDFLITREAFNKIQPFLNNAGYVEEYSQESFARLRSAKSYPMDIDFMFVARSTLADMEAEGKNISIAGQTMKIPSLDHLIALKLHSIKHNPRMREFKDMADIVQLVIANKIDVRSSGFEKLCLKYGTAELYRKIVEAVS